MSTFLHIHILTQNPNLYVNYTERFKQSTAYQVLFGHIGSNGGQDERQCNMYNMHLRLNSASILEILYDDEFKLLNVTATEKDLHWVMVKEAQEAQLLEDIAN